MFGRQSIGSRFRIAVGALKIIGVADCVVSADPTETLATYALGSCIAVVSYDSQARVGGIVHFALPDSTMDWQRANENPFGYADLGVPELIKRCIDRGAERRRLSLAAVGGANMVTGCGPFQVGQKNHLSLQKTVPGLGLSLRVSAIGGSQARSVRLEIGTGAIWLKE